MIVIDTSALIAFLLEEPEAGRIAHTLYTAGDVAIAAPVMFEFLMVAGSHRVVRVQPRATELANRFLADVLKVMPFEVDHARLAEQAFLKYGKGTGHPAKLNFGDCISYALAKALDAPLLYKGDDFAQTDIRSAL